MAKLLFHLSLILLSAVTYKWEYKCPKVTVTKDLLKGRKHQELQLKTCIYKIRNYVLDRIILTKYYKNEY